TQVGREAARAPPVQVAPQASKTSSRCLLLLRRRCRLLVGLRSEALFAIGLLGVIGARLFQARGLLLFHGHRLLGRRLLLRALTISLLLGGRGGGRCGRGGLRHGVADRAKDECQADNRCNHLSHVLSPPFRCLGSFTSTKSLSTNTLA